MTRGGTPRAAEVPVEVREEVRDDGAAPLLVHAAWESAFPGLVAGITAAAPGADYGLATAPGAWEVLERWEALADRLGLATVAVARQVHGTRVVRLDPPADGAAFVSGGRADGLVTAGEGLLLGATAADCVPVYLVDEATGALGLLHAGWRGTAAGVLAAGVDRLAREFGARPAGLRVHLGPAICGGCYEVGPEVFAALGREAPAGGGPGHLDLRGELAARAASVGIDPGRITVSAWCTRCSAGRLHSHRGGGSAAGRMAAFLGWRMGRMGPIL